MHKLVLACGLALAATSPSVAQEKIIERLGPVEVNEPVLSNLGPKRLNCVLYPGGRQVRCPGSDMAKGRHRCKRRFSLTP